MLVVKTDYPKEWKRDVLANVCDWGSGGTPLSSVNEYYNNGQIKWAIIGDLNEGILFDTQRKITNEGLKNSSAKIVPKGALLVGMYGSIGKTAITGCKMATNQAIAFGIPKDNVMDLYFLKYFINLNVSNLFRLSKGGTQKNISQEVLKKLPIFFPTITEQKIIVQEIEKQFTRLEKVILSLEEIKEKLKSYRKSVLNNFVERGGTAKTIESIILSLDQGWSPKCCNEPAQNVAEWGVIKTTAIQAGHFNEAENKRLPSNLKLRLHHELRKGDLLITRAGPRARVGVCCLVKRVRPRLLNCDKVYRLRIDPEIAIPEYIEIALNSPRCSEEINRMKTGISDSGVNLTQKGFKKILVPIPEIKKQRQIVQKSDSIFSVLDKLETTIDDSLLKAEILRKAVLKTAFEGNLNNLMVA